MTDIMSWAITLKGSTIISFLSTRLSHILEFHRDLHFHGQRMPVFGLLLSLRFDLVSPSGLHTYQKTLGQQAVSDQAQQVCQHRCPPVARRGQRSQRAKPSQRVAS